MIEVNFLALQVHRHPKSFSYSFQSAFITDTITSISSTTRKLKKPPVLGLNVPSLTTKNFLNYCKTNFLTSRMSVCKMPLTQLNFLWNIVSYPSWHASIVADDFVFALAKRWINYQFVISSIIVVSLKLIPTSKVWRCSAALRLTGC